MRPKLCSGPGTSGLSAFRRLTQCFPRCVPWTISNDNNHYMENERGVSLGPTLETVGWSKEHRSLYCRTSWNLSCNNVLGKPPSENFSIWLQNFFLLFSRMSLGTRIYGEQAWRENMDLTHSSILFPKNHVKNKKGHWQEEFTSPLWIINVATNNY